MCAYPYTHTYQCTHTLSTCIHVSRAYTHTHTHKCTHTLSTCIHVYVCIHTHTHTHQCTHTSKGSGSISVNAPKAACTHTYAHLHTHTHSERLWIYYEEWLTNAPKSVVFIIHGLAYIHIHIRTYIHIYTRIYTHTLKGFGSTTRNGPSTLPKQ